MLTTLCSLLHLGYVFHHASAIGYMLNFTGSIQLKINFVALKTNKKRFCICYYCLSPKQLSLIKFRSVLPINWYIKTMLLDAQKINT